MVEAGKALKKSRKPGKKYRKFGRKPKNAILESRKDEKKNGESCKQSPYSRPSSVHAEKNYVCMQKKIMYGMPLPDALRKEKLHCSNQWKSNFATHLD